MIDSPILQDMILEAVAEKLANDYAEGMAEGMRSGIMRILKKRFTDDIVSALEKIMDCNELERLIDWALTCPDLDSFRQQLSQET